jgi:hypothetical protein
MKAKGKLTIDNGQLTINSGVLTSNIYMQESVDKLYIDIPCFIDLNLSLKRFLTPFEMTVLTF